MTPSEAYLKLAKGVVEHFITHRKGAELWWINEKPHRQKNELTPEHEQELIKTLATKFPRPKQENPNGQHE